MISFFPSFFNDELLYSALARYHKRSGNINCKETLVTLFGKSTLSAVVDFPANLETLCKNIVTNKYTPDYLIDNHTLFPYYQPFLSDNKILTIKEQMAFGNSDHLYLSLGLAPSKVKGPDYLRYCLSCYQGEVERYGEAYWHRTCQLPGVLVCPIHKTALFTSDIPIRNKQHKHQFFTLDEQRIELGKKIAISESHFGYLLFIAEQSLRLLNESNLLTGIEKIRQFYLLELKERGLLTSNRRIKVSELVTEFLNTFEYSFLQLLGSNFDAYDKDTWFHKVLRKPRTACHPLRHLLVLYFLQQELPGNLVNLNMAEHPFGKGPWPCLNRAATHYQELLIHDCVVTQDYRTGRPIGSFTCKECQFSYSRSGPDSTDEDKYKIGKVKNFGDVWKDKLSRLYSIEKLSMRKISSELGVSPKTVKRYIEKSIYERETGAGKNAKENKKKKYQETFIKLKNEYPSFNRTQLRNTNPAMYAWLYKYEKDWLFRNLPLSHIGNNASIQIDWNKRDNEYSFLIIKKAIEIFMEYPLKRVTKTGIARKLDLLPKIANQIDKLPICRVILADITETVEEFQIRKVRFYAKKFRKESIPYTQSSLMKIAGLKKEMSNRIKLIIVEELKNQRYETMEWT